MNIRALDKADITEIAEYLAEAQLAGLTGLPEDRGLPLSVDIIADGVDKWRTGEHGFIRVIEVEGIVAGHVRCDWWWDAFTPRVEVVVRPERRNLGLGTSAGRWVLAHLFENTPAHTVHASTPAWNEAGLHFAETLGFERAGAIRRVGIRDGSYFDSFEFELLRERWEVHDGVDR